LGTGWGNSDLKSVPELYISFVLKKHGVPIDKAIRTLKRSRKLAHSCPTTVGRNRALSDKMSYGVSLSMQ